MWLSFRRKGEILEVALLLNGVEKRLENTYLGRKLYTYGTYKWATGSNKTTQHKKWGQIKCHRNIPQIKTI